MSSGAGRSVKAVTCPHRQKDYQFFWGVIEKVFAEC